MPSFFHLAKLLDQHFLGNRRSSSLRLREAQDLAAEEMEQDEELSSSFEHFERLLHILSGGEERVFLPLTLGCAPSPLRIKSGSKLRGRESAPLPRL
jgi:hypothetical protein